MAKIMNLLMSHKKFHTKGQPKKGNGATRNPFAPLPLNLTFLRETLYFSTSREITNFWISLVPSPIVQSFASR
jgi:hypothetical protein